MAPTYETAEAEWKDLLEGTHPHLQKGSPLRFVPSSPRCRLCRAPFGAPGRFVLSRYGFAPWEKNPNMCMRCFKNLKGQSDRCPGDAANDDVRGAVIQMSVLFADVRGSSKLARQMSTHDFTHLMGRFFHVSRDVLLAHDAIIEKFVGDEIVGLFLPLLTGQEHARHALDAAHHLLTATGHDDPDGPWAPTGAAVHTGEAFVGMVGRNEASDFTALGDVMNVCAHLAAQAGVGEVLVTEATAEAAGVGDGLERRQLSLKGHPLEALVSTTVPAASAAS
jgi:adenylate cyclase